MKLLYGTTNPAKIQHMQEVMEGLDFEVIGLNDIDIHIDGIDETGNDPLENAKIKALAYYKATGMPVFSCDSGLYIEGIEDERQPGVHVRRVGHKVLSDEEMIDYYSNLALEFGGELKARYRNAIALIIDESRMYTYDGEDIASDSFIISSKPHEKRDIGFPLNSLSVEVNTRKYYMDLNPTKTRSSKVTLGFRNFFKGITEE